MVSVGSTSRVMVLPSSPTKICMLVASPPRSAGVLLVGQRCLLADDDVPGLQRGPTPSPRRRPARASASTAPPRPHKRSSGAFLAKYFRHDTRRPQCREHLASPLLQVGASRAARVRPARSTSLFNKSDPSSPDKPVAERLSPALREARPP